MSNRLEFQKANGFSVPVVFTDAQGTRVDASFDSAAFQSPWTLAEIQSKLNDPNDRQQAQSIGQGLFERVFLPGSLLRAAWDNLGLPGQGQPLEIAFADPAFRGYPWELLQQPTGDIPALLTSFVRRVANKQALPKGSDWPFRLLVLVGSSDPAIGAAQELEAI